MKWNTGNWTSYPDDGRAYLERNSQGWWVYGTDETGSLVVVCADPLQFAPPLYPEPFASVTLAQDWVRDNVPARG